MPKRVLAPCTLINIQSWDTKAALRPAVEESLCIVWPREVGTVSRGQADVICVGPTTWLLLAADLDSTSWFRRLEVALHDSSFRATDISKAVGRIQIDTPYTRDLLAKGCSLDLHPALFPPGRAARVRLAGVPVTIRCMGGSAFECMVTLSYADYLACWLEDAALEFSGVPE
jgi:sarcosine oxidase, subunit gamma